MRVEHFKIKELFAKPKLEVFGVVPGVRVSTPIEKPLPCFVNFSLCHPVGLGTATIGEELSEATTARVRKPDPKRMRYGRLNISAVAFADPGDPHLSANSNIGTTLNNCESSKAHPGKVHERSSSHVSMIHQGLSVFLFLLVFFVCFTPRVDGQPYALAPAFEQQFFDNNGLPLANGFIVSCAAGLACSYPTPANPQTTWTDASAFTSNPNPIPLSPSGRANIWINTALLYKFVLVASNGVIIKTVDNVSAAPGGGGSTTNYWTLTGTTIANNNGGGAGDVSIGGGLSVANDITVNGNLKLRDADSSANYAMIRAANNMAADVQWRWPATDLAGCLRSDGLGNLSFNASCGGGGGGGSPGGNVSDIQFNNGTFGGSDNFTWNNSGQVAVITAASTSNPGLVVLSGYIQSDNGFDAVVNASPSTARNWNVIQAPTGGMHALSFTADKYFEMGSNAGTPTATTGEPSFPHAGAMYCDTTGSPCVPKLYDGTGWVSLATGGATSPGGANTNVQYNSGGSFAGSSNFTFASQRLTVIGSSSSLPAIYGATGYIQSDAGFLASPGSATRYNVIQAPGGGMAAQSFTATNYIQTGSSAGPFSTAPPTPTSTDTFHAGAMSFDVASGTEQVYNGTNWVPLGGGSGTPGGPTTSIQFNNAGSFLGSSNFTWNNSSRALTINGIAGTADLVALGGWVQSDTGFLAMVNSAPSTPLAWNSFQSPQGGMYAKSFRAANYMQSGTSAGVPTLTTGDTFVPGAIYYDTMQAAERYFDGFSWHNFAAGGIISLNSLTGTLTIAGTTNQVNVASGGSTITLSTPQNINTTANVNFGTVTTSGAVTSTAVGSATAFSATAGFFAVNGDGFVNAQSIQILGGAGFGVNVLANNAANSIQTIGGANLCNSGTCSGGSALSIAGSTIINSAGVGSFAGLGVSGNALVTGSVISGATVSGGTISAVTGFTANGNPGVTGSTCHHWTYGICDAL